MINIISRSYNSKYTRGPKKVVDNLIKGLQKIDYPFVVNQPLNSTPRLWIHDDLKSLSKIKKLQQNIQVVVGPNLFVLPSQIKHKYKLSNCIYLQPSDWVKDFWEFLGFKECSVKVWPVGIDTDYWYNDENKEKNEVLIYVKKRNESDLRLVKKILINKNIKFSIIKYGEYNEESYKKRLSKAKYIIWMDEEESQNIALIEALSFGIAVLVWEKKSEYWKKDILAKKFLTFKFYNKPTTAPFFNNRCGFLVDNSKKLEKYIDLMENRWDSFESGKYVRNSLNLIRQAEKFISLYKENFGDIPNKWFSKNNKIKCINNKKFFLIYYNFIEFFKKNIKLILNIKR